MSTLTVTNIKATGETASRAVSGVAAAWVNFNQSTPAIRDSFNTSSLTDTSLGKGDLSWTNAMGNVNYAVSTGVNAASSATAYSAVIMDDSDTAGRAKTASVYYYQSTYAASSYSDFGDPKYGVLSVNGDLA